MGTVINVRQGHSIYVHTEEISFIEKTLEAKGINIDCFDKEQQILNLHQSYVGFIKTSKRMIRLEPKEPSLSLNHILRLYYFVHGNFKNFNDNIYDVSKSENYMNIIDEYIKELNTIRRRGLPSNYVSRKENTQYVQGSVDFVESYKNIIKHNKEPFLCEFDELTLDTPLNRTLYSAFKKVKKMRKNQKSSNSMEALFLDVNGSYNPTSSVTFSSKNYYCKQAYLLAKLILDESYFDGSGSMGGECFLINYDDLFEAFIKKILFGVTKDINFMDWNSDMEYGIHKGDIKSYRPDILYTYKKKEKKANAVIDAKNKFSGLFKNADVYQMIFYSTMLKAGKLILCYPSTEKKEVEELDIYSEDFISNKIKAVFINVASEKKEEFKEDIDFFIEKTYEAIEST